MSATMSPLPKPCGPPHSMRTPIIVATAAPQTCRPARSRSTTHPRTGVMIVAVLTRKLTFVTVADRYADCINSRATANIAATLMALGQYPGAGAPSRSSRMKGRINRPPIRQRRPTALNGSRCSSTVFCATFPKRHRAAAARSRKLACALDMIVRFRGGVVWRAWCRSCPEVGSGRAGQPALPTWIVLISFATRCCSCQRWGSWIPTACSAATVLNRYSAPDPA